MSVYVCGASSVQRKLTPELRQQLHSTAQRFPPELHRTISLPFCVLEVAWDPWHLTPVAEAAERKLTLLLLGDCFLQNARLSAEDILGYFIKSGMDGLQNLEGEYLVIVIDTDAERLWIRSDLWGLRKLYLLESKGILLFATELECFRTIECYRPKLDCFAAAQLLITSHLCDDHSLLEGVTLLPAAQILTADSTGVVQRSYWAPSIDRTAMTLEQSVGVMHDTLYPSMQMRLESEGDLLLPLSGGLDSRILAGLLTKAQCSTASACSYGHGHSYDLRLGRRIAKQLNIKHQSLMLPPRIHRRYISNSLSLADGEISIEAFPLFRLLEVDKPGQTMISGFLGDWVSAKKLLSDEASLEQGMETLWQKLYVRQGFDQATYDKVVCNSELRAGYDALRQTVQETYNNADAPDHQGKAQLLEFWHRQRRYVSYQLKVLESRFKVVAPFADSRLISQWLNLPISANQQQLAYKLLLQRISPPLAAIPLGGDYRQIPVTTNECYKDLDAFSYLRVLVGKKGIPPGIQWRLNGLLNHLGKGLASISGGWCGTHGRGDLVHHDEDIRRNDPQWFKRRLLDPAMTEGYFDPSALRTLFAEHQQGRKNHSIRINNIIVLSEFRKHWGI